MLYPIKLMTFLCLNVHETQVQGNFAKIKYLFQTNQAHDRDR